MQRDSMLMLSTTQLSLFPIAPALCNEAAEPALLLMACSGSKLDRNARAMDLYRGVMYESYRAHLRSDSPNVLILSAQHGFLDPHAEIAPYDERMTPQRVDQMMADLPTYIRPAAWPDRVATVMLAGGKEYRRVMRAALALQYGPAALPVLQETTGGIGMQRSQLGAFLDGLAPVFRDRIGQHANGTPIYRRYGWIEVGAIATLLYRAAPNLPARRARVLSVFNGPSGPTADVEVEEFFRGRSKICPRWVSVADLHPSSEVPA